MSTSIPKSRQLLATVAGTVAIVAAVFVLTVLSLLAAQMIASQGTSLIDNESLNQMMEHARNYPEDTAAIEQLRTIDQASRRSYFGALLWRQQGLLLAICGFLIAAAALQLRAMLTRSTPDPRESPAVDAENVRRRAFMAATAAAASVAVIATAIIAFAPSRGAAPGTPRKAQPSPPPNTSTVVNDLDAWSGFRGPNGLGIASRADPPLTWDGPTGENVRWIVPLERPGFSSPVVWGEHLFLTGGDQTSRDLMAFNTEDGSLRWGVSIPLMGGSLPKVTDDTGFAAPTPATDGRHVYVIYATGDVAAFDFDGNLVWQRSLGVPVNMYAYASSPIAAEGLLLIQYDQEDTAYLYALDGSTGEERWSAPRDVKVSWSSPILIAPPNGEQQVVLNAKPYLSGYRLSDGALLWDSGVYEEYEDVEVAPSPAFDGERVFVVNEYAILAAVSPAGPAEILWSLDDNGYHPDISSPVAANGILYVASSAGTIVAYDSAEGEMLWEYEGDEGFSSSPILAGDRLYALDNEGTMHVLASGRELRPLAKNALALPSSCTPAFVRDRIYIRTRKQLVCVGGGQ